MSELRKEIAERLAAERGPIEEATDNATEEPIAGDPEDVESTDVGTEDGTDSLLDPGQDTEQPDEGDAQEDGEEDISDPKYVELENRYKELQSRFSQVTANRKEIEKSLEEASVAATQRMHELEDKFSTAEQYAEYYAGLANQQVMQIQQQLNQPNLPADQFQQLYTQFNQAQARAHQFQQGLTQVKTQREQTQEAQRKREAELTAQRIKARIPDWNSEKSAALLGLAQEMGYSEEEAQQITDYRTVLMLNELHEARKARSAVKEPITKRKTQPPKSQSGSQPRNAQGQFARAQEEFNSNPGKRGAAANMFAARLRAEREGR